jgi:hypothetical protein
LLKEMMPAAPQAVSDTLSAIAALVIISAAVAARIVRLIVLLHFRFDAGSHAGASMIPYGFAIE